MDIMGHACKAGSMSAAVPYHNNASMHLGLRPPQAMSRATPFAHHVTNWVLVIHHSLASRPCRISLVLQSHQSYAKAE
jgi:hypothetical protein